MGDPLLRTTHRWLGSGARAGSLLTALLLHAAPAIADGAAPHAPEPGVEVHRSRPIEVKGERPKAEIYEDGPIEKQVIRAQEIRDHAVSSAAEIVGFQPGVRIQQRNTDGGEEAAVSIEGLPPEFTQVLVDGQRYSGEVGGVADLDDIPTVNVERIEILRGAQALRYGTDAAGGVINVVTKDAPAVGYEVIADGGYGTLGKTLATGHAGFRLGKLGATLTLNLDEQDGFDPRVDGASVFSAGGGGDSTKETKEFYSRLDYPVTDEFELFGSASFRREDEDLVITPFAAETGEAEGADVTFTTVGITDATASNRVFERWLASMGFRWQATESMFIDGEVNYYDPELESTFGRSFVVDDHEWRFRLTGEQYFATGPVENLFVLSLDARLPDLVVSESSQSEVFADGFGLDVPDGADEGWAQVDTAFAVESNWNDWITLVAGGRYVHHTEFENKIVPQVALMLQPHPRFRVRLSWGELYRTPSLREVYQPPIPGPGGAYFLSGNSELTPESGSVYRAGFEWTPFDWLSLSTTGFWNQIDDRISTLQDGQINTGVTIRESTQIIIDESKTCQDALALAELLMIDPYDIPGFAAECPIETRVEEPIPFGRDLFRSVNLDEVRTRGAEFQLNFRPSRYLDFRAAYTYLDNDVADEDRPLLVRLPNEPEHVVDLQGIFTLPKARTRFSVLARFRGKALRETSGTGATGFTSLEESNPSWMVNTRITQPVGRHVELYFDVRNLTDQRVVDSYQVRPRTYFAGVRISLGGSR